MGRKRTFTKEFKLDILRELESKSAAEVCREHNLHSVLVHRWKREYEVNPREAFSGRGRVWRDEAKLSEYKRLVGYHEKAPSKEETIINLKTESQ